MSAFLALPTPTLPPHLRALSAAAARQDPDSGYSTNMRPLRHRRPAAEQPNPFVISPDQPCPPDNETMLQGFEWYVPADGSHWRRLARAMPALRRLGVAMVWIPPACKAARPEGNGYDVYDLWDLGEFEQKGHGRAGTKWGAKGELVAMAEEAARCGVRVLFDAVLNHKAGADFVERARATRVAGGDRSRAETGVVEIEAWSGFEFAGRGGRYSGMRWGKEHFTGIDWDDVRKEKGVWRFEGKEWAPDVDEELGNYDFLSIDPLFYPVELGRGRC
ncbi:glycoside hydrolase family 13 protein [Trichocladium antarcticum]|uniref:Glycoside hydrolase family 13 protein n=1 Tax=Trichocladium antarcticum TaxID=1450529 RepID=A0AAN6UG78_9PEZI|nr:glycoside hydrolase family 13 protein [Trichocladium antarcticum]